MLTTEYMFFLLQPGQIIDIRAMLNDATRLNVEEGSNNFTNVGDVSSIVYLILHQPRHWKSLK